MAATEPSLEPYVEHVDPRLLDWPQHWRGRQWRQRGGRGHNRRQWHNWRGAARLPERAILSLLNAVGKVYKRFMDEGR